MYLVAPFCPPAHSLKIKKVLKANADKTYIFHLLSIWQNILVYPEEIIWIVFLFNFC